MTHEHYPFHYSRELPKRNNLTISTVHDHTHPPLYSRAMRAEHARRHNSQRTAQGYDPYNSVDRFYTNVYVADGVDLDTICALPPRTR